MAVIPTLGDTEKGFKKARISRVRVAVGVQDPGLLHLPRLMANAIEDMPRDKLCRTEP